MPTTSLQKKSKIRRKITTRKRIKSTIKIKSRPHALAKGMLEGLPYVAILLLLLLLLLVLFLILLFIFLLCASRLSTRQSKVDGTLGLVSPKRQRNVPRTAPRSPALSGSSPCYSMQARSNPQPPGVENRGNFPGALLTASPPAAAT